jgi:phosphoglycerol transferase MdoB-like AlkP superfamily enzyme
MSLAYSPTFALNVVAGYLLTVLGAVLALAAAVWWVRAQEWAHGEPRPPAFRALSALAFVLFVAGLFWQLIGYLRLNYTSGW